MADRIDPFEQALRFYEETEQRTAEAMEQLVRRDSFGEIVARMTENVMALTRIGFDVSDLVVRNLRLAGRQDVIRLGRQLARTEDKLELVLQAVERLEAEVAAEDGEAPRARSERRAAEDGGSSPRGAGAASGRGGDRSGGARGGQRSGSSGAEEESSSGAGEESSPGAGAEESSPGGSGSGEGSPGEGESS